MSAKSQRFTSRGRAAARFVAQRGLLKPVTWFPPMWAFLCGVVSSGVRATGFSHAMPGRPAAG